MAAVVPLTIIRDISAGSLRSVSDAQTPMPEMKSFSENTHSFIVRIWLEPRDLEGAEPQLRGEIEHVPSSERRYLKDLSEIAFFIAPYLGEMGV